HLALLPGARHVAASAVQLGAPLFQLAACLRVSLLEHFEKILRVHGVLLLALDLRRHLLQHRDQSLQTMLERGLAPGIGFGSDLPLPLLRRGHALLREGLDGIRPPLLPVVALSRGRYLAAEIVEMLLHRAQLGLAGRLRIPPYERLYTGLHRLVCF